MTSREIAFITQPSSTDFQLNSYFASITLPISCYAGPKVWTCSNPLNSRTLDTRQISTCFDASASVTVDCFGKSLVGAVGRSISALSYPCSLRVSLKGSRFASFFAAQAWSDMDIRPMLWRKYLMVRVLPRMRPGMRTSASCPSSRTTRSGMGARGFNGAGAVAVTSGGAYAGTDTAVIIRRFGNGRSDCWGKGNNRFPWLVPCDVA